MRINAGFINDIDDKIGVMESLKEELEIASTKDEIKEIGKEIISAWTGMKFRIRLHAERIINSKIGDVLERAKHLEDRLESILSGLEEEGYDISGADQLVDDFSEKIEEARENYASASEKFSEALNEADQEEIDDLIKEGNLLVRVAHDNLKEAHTILKDIVRELKEIKNDIDLSEDDVEDDFEVVIPDDLDNEHEDIDEENISCGAADDCTDQPHDECEGNWECIENTCSWNCTS